MFDSHCHLHDARLVGEAAALLDRARAAGVRGFLLAGVDTAGWRVEAALGAAHADVAVSYGLHPQRVAELDDDACDGELAALDAALQQKAPVAACALGEIGLDGVGERVASLERQERLFRAQLALARRHRLPVALHVLKQHPRALAVLADWAPVDGVLHSCSASAELTREYLALGLHVSFSGSLTWHGGANRTRRAAEVVPPECALVETDAPDQTPEPHRPGRNEPAFLVAIVEALAHIWGQDRAAVGRRTEDNARRLFGLVSHATRATYPH